MLSTPDLNSNIRRIEAAFNDHQLSDLLTHFSANVAITRGDGETHFGARLILDFLSGLFTNFPKAHLSVNRIQALDKNVAMIEWHFSGEHSSNSRFVNAAFAALLSFDSSNKIAKIEVRGDTAALYSDPPAIESASLDSDKIRQMAEDYKNGWCNRDPSKVASFYAEDGFIIINGGTPWAGRVGLAAMSGGFIEAYPDAVLTTDDLHINVDRAVWSWTFTGTNTGPGGSGARVQFSGYEVWRINEDYKIAESYGYYDSAI